MASKDAPVRERSGGPINRILAIHHLHIAVEILLKCVVLHLGIRPEKELNIGFEALIDAVNRSEQFADRGC